MRVVVCIKKYKKLVMLSLPSIDENISWLETTSSGSSSEIVLSVVEDDGTGSASRLTLFSISSSLQSVSCTTSSAFDGHADEVDGLGFCSTSISSSKTKI